MNIVQQFNNINPETREIVKNINSSSKIVDTVPSQHLEFEIRSQRLSDTYPIRLQIAEHTDGYLSRLYKKFIAFYILKPLITFIFPMVLNNSNLVSLFGIQPSSKATLLCPMMCDDGHICQYYENHSGKHICVFGHKIGKPIQKCHGICDCRSCDSDCAYPPGHSGIHKCNFRHYWNDIPSSKVQLLSFRNDKSIGDYVDELAYSTPEDMKFSNIPETLKKPQETWFEG